MPTNKLGLPLLTGNETADIPRDFNALAEKIDEKAGSPDGLAQLDGNGKTPTTQLPDASTSQKGATKLNDTTNSTSITEAATANAVRKVNDALVSHSADNLSHVPYAVDSGTANAKVVTLNPTPTSYTDGMALTFKNNVQNTGSVTINVNNLGAKTVKKSNGNALSSGNLKAGIPYTLRYNGTDFILQGEGGEYGTAVASDVLFGKTIGTEDGVISGTMPNNGAVTITPGSANKTIASGYHNGNGIVVGDVDLVASNIKKGIDIFGVVGTLDITSLGGKRWANGVAASAFGFVEVRGLAFRPSVILIKSMTALQTHQYFSVYSNKNILGGLQQIYSPVSMLKRPLTTVSLFMMTGLK